MAQTREARAPHLAERWWWEVARRDDPRVARRLDRQQVIDGVDQLDDGARLDDFFSCLPQLGVVDLLDNVQGTAVQRERVPVVQSLLRYRLKTLGGIERRPALPAWLFSDEARRRRVGVKAQPGRQGVCQRGAAPRQGPRTTGPLGPEALADHLVTLNVRDLEVWGNGVIRALATAGVCVATVTGLVEATDLDTTAQEEGRGHVTSPRQVTDQRGQGHEIEVTVDGGQLRVWIAARTKLPWAATVVPIQAPETLSLRALVTPARTTLAGHARRHTVVCDQGVVAGVDRWWRDQHGLRWVVPAQANLAVTSDAQAHAAAGEGLTVGGRGHTVRHGDGNTAWTDRLETAVVGIAGLTSDDQEGTPQHGRQPHRRDVHPTPINAVVVRTWHHRDDGPGGNPVFLTKAAVDKPWRPCDADDERRLIEHGGLKERQPPWSVPPPPQKPTRAVRGHVLFTVLLVALATAYRLPCEPADLGTEPVGWQRWRRPLVEQPRAQVMVVAQHGYGIFPRAESTRR